MAAEDGPLKTRANPTFCLVALIALLAIAPALRADIWKWIDTDGNVRYVDSATPIYAWRDKNGEIAFSDRPEHPDAVKAQLVWHSAGSLADLEAEDDVGSDEPGAYPGETAEDRRERERAEAYYCKQARAVYDTCVQAPRLFRTDEDGQRYYLTEEEVAATIAETKARMDELCR